MSKTAAVIVNYNGGDLNNSCIDSLLEQDETAIIVVDNDSADGSPDRLISRYGTRITLLRMGRNLGFGRACNVGAAHADAEYLLFFNNDAVADPRMVRELVSALRDNADVGIAGPVVLEAFDRTLIQSTGSTIDRWGFTFDSTAGLPIDRLPASSVREAFYIPGCALLISTSLFRQLGGFDEGMFMFAEDVDLCWRAWLAGRRVITVRSAVCEHIGGGTATVGVSGGTYRTSEFRIREREQNTFRMMLVNLGAKHLIQYLCVFYPVTLLEALGAYCIGKRWIARSYMSAFRHILETLPDTLSRRKAIQSSRRVDDSMILRMWSRRYEKLGFLTKKGMPQDS